MVNRFEILEFIRTHGDWAEFEHKGKLYRGILIPNAHIRSELNVHTPQLVRLSTYGLLKLFWVDGRKWVLLPESVIDSMHRKGKEKFTDFLKDGPRKWSFSKRKY